MWTVASIAPLSMKSPNLPKEREHTSYGTRMEITPGRIHPGQHPPWGRSDTQGDTQLKIKVTTRA